MLQTNIAVEKRIIRLPTAVPKTLPASLAPRDQPRNSPLLSRKIVSIVILQMGSCLLLLSRGLLNQEF